MKTLNLHCDYINFKALKKALKNIDELAPNQDLEGEAKECLVVLVSVEKSDDQSTVTELFDSVVDIASQVKVKNVVLYPYAHLSSNLGSPKLAVTILDEAAKVLNKKFSLTRAPFGYYKQFEFKTKGHPLSELAREFKGDESKEESVEELSSAEVKQLLRQISKSRLDTSKLKDNDHRIIGSKLDLWSFNSVAPGMVFWHDKGLHIKNKLIEFWRDLQSRNGYLEISTPQIMDRKVWEISGHWSKYGENNFRTSYEGRDFLVKPMNCPGGALVFKTSPKSYKDLPLRVAEMGSVHRVELSGVLAGLFRVIQFTQDDAHIFCTEDQLESEVLNIVGLIRETFSLFNLDFDHVELSTRPQKRIGSDKTWDFTEKALEKILKKSKLKFKINKGDGAFYGPKIDFHVKDSLNRTWQCSTIQLDMSMPERFDLSYKAADGSVKRPVMLHRVIYGSLERFIAIITEHVSGKFPLWLSPNQVKVLSMNDDCNVHAEKVYEQLRDVGLRVELDVRSESMGKKVREAGIHGFNYIVTIGQKEVDEKVVAVKERDQKKIELVKVDDFIVKLKSQIASRSV